MPAVLPADFFAFDKNHAICEPFHVQLDGAHNEAKLSIISMLSSYPLARPFRPQGPGSARLWHLDGLEVSAVDALVGVDITIAQG